MHANTLGDAGVPGGGSDAAYTGDTGESSLSLQYYRNKVTEYQNTLNAIDKAANAAMIALDSGALSEADAQALDDSLYEYENNKTKMRLTAEAINAGAAAINSMGGRFPSLSIPTGLGLLPLAVPAATIAAIGVAAALVVWGNTWIKGVNERMKRSVVLDAIQDPGQKAQVAQAIALSDSAVQESEASSLSGIASILKWGALAVGGFLIYKQFIAKE